jgi:hypothetical protein
MIVDYLNTGDDYSLIKIFSEIYTISGFIVRSKDELFPCSVCNKAIPNRETFNKIKELDIYLPISDWDNTCFYCVS